MAFIQVKNVKLSGVSACVPHKVEESVEIDLFKGDEAEKFMESTGVERRRIAKPGTTT